jgi:hypothetical protein
MKDSKATNNKEKDSRDRTATPTSIGSTGDAATDAVTDNETPSDSVRERNQGIQEEKIRDVSERNDTMHNPAMEIGKSYAVTTDDVKSDKK